MKKRDFIVGVTPYNVKKRFKGKMAEVLQN